MIDVAKSSKMSNIMNNQAIYKENYNKEISQAIHIIKGNLHVVKVYFRNMMTRLAEKLEYEEAHKFKEKIELLEKFKSKSVVVNPKLTNIQICTIISNENEAFLNYLRVTNGAITYTKTTRVKKKLQEDEDVLVGL